MTTTTNGSLSLSAQTRAAGDIALTCAEPGAWQFSLSAEPGDVETLRIVLDAPEEAFPPKFTVAFAVPQGDVRHVWHPAAEHGFVPPDWHGCGHHRTSIASGMPLVTLVGLNDENRLAFVAARLCALRRAPAAFEPLYSSWYGFHQGESQVTPV